MTADAERSDLTDGELLKPLILLSLPIVAAQLLQVAYNLTDTFWVGRLGADAVTALSLSFPLLFLVMSLGGGMTLAGTVLVAQNRGAGRSDRVGHVAGQTLVFVWLLAAVLAALGYLLAPTLLSVIGGSVSERALALSIEYTRILFLGVVFMFVFFIFQALLRGYGDTLTPMYLMLGSVLLNLVLDPVLILGFTDNPLFAYASALPLGVDFLALETTLFEATGFGGMGVTGAAIATVISRGAAAMTGLALLFSGRIGLSISVADLRPEPATIRKIVEIGVPTAAEQGANTLAYTAVTALAALVSGPTVAAYGVGNRINSLVFLPAMGLAQGTETAVGQNLGAAKPERAKRAVRFSCGIVTVVFGVLSVAIFVFARPLVTFFVPGEPAVIALGTDYFRIIGPSYVFMGIFQVVKGGFRGAGSTQTAMVFTLLSQWVVRIPAMYLFVTMFDLGASSIWLGLAISNVLAALLVSGWYLRGTWIKSAIETEGGPSDGSSTDVEETDTT